MSIIAKTENLRLKFPGADTLVFKDLSVTFAKGEKVLLLGPSGCGKSTLLQVLSGLIPHSIEVPIKADQIVVPPSSGFVFQDPDTQFCMPFVDEEIAFVLENLQFPREKMKDEIHRLLSEVGLELNDIHTNINSLSGGMKQRLAIASVLALDPEVLFLDEPTAMLDPDGTKEIWETIQNVGSDKTVLIVEHKLDHVIDFVDRILLFNGDGEIVANGPAKEILSCFRHEFRKYGIWYPGVWEEYLAERRNTGISNKSWQREVLYFEEFEGLRKKEPKIHIAKARVKEGEWIAVMGKNGAGKSTLLHSVMQFLKTRGVCEVNGSPVEKVKMLSNELSFVFQNPEFQFVTNSVYDELAYSMVLAGMDEEAIREKVEKLLTEFYLQNQRHHHPYQLSMGQKRRLSVAASIGLGQRILLLDEPTFGQDSKNTFALLEMLEILRESGSTILMVTHDKNIAEHFATRIWNIADGWLAEEAAKTNQSEQRVLV